MPPDRKAENIAKHNWIGTVVPCGQHVGTIWSEKRDSMHCRTQLQGCRPRDVRTGHAVSKVMQESNSPNWSNAKRGLRWLNHAASASCWRLQVLCSFRAGYLWTIIDLSQPWHLCH
jgi:hypothetical protein